MRARSRTFRPRMNPGSNGNGAGVKGGYSWKAVGLVTSGRTEHSWRHDELEDLVWIFSAKYQRVLAQSVFLRHQRARKSAVTVQFWHSRRHGASCAFRRVHPFPGHCGLVSLGACMSEDVRGARMPVCASAEIVSCHVQDAGSKDYFIEQDGVRFAGKHLLVELWDANCLNDAVVIDETLRTGAIAAGATILHGHFHTFTPNGGVSGVLVLAESHISIHTWPERGYAAVDIFMCGACEPAHAVPAMQAAFRPGRVDLHELRRGVF
jgi:S-adenosylmethionine decarboxylase